MVGLIVKVPGRRSVFLPIGRVTSMGSDSDQIIATDITAQRFEQRGSEVRIIGELLGRKILLTNGSDEATIKDVVIEENGHGDWEVSQLLVRRRKTTSSPFVKGSTALVSWPQIREKTEIDEPQPERLIATFSELKPADLAKTLRDLPTSHRLEIAAELPDERLADVLAEMPEQEQVEIFTRLNVNHAADVLNQMQPDDATDLIARLPIDLGERLLELMEPEEAHDVRMLLSYPPESAGGLMTPEPIIVSAGTTVAEGLALIRRHDVAPVLAAAVYITLPPHEPPTGRFLGIVHFQQMLRYPPHEHLGTLIDHSFEPVRADTSAAEVSRILASYNLVSVPVVDDDHHLVGVVTIDDILDYLLPANWRSDDAAGQGRARTHAQNPYTAGHIAPGGRRLGSDTTR
jgi:CBS domain-containing protein/sporulation protein YlmC with PRC-barrel domain